MLTLHGIAAMAVAAAALFFFSRDRIPLEYTSIGVMTILVVGFELFPFHGEPTLRGVDFLSAISNEALITICLLLILAKGLEVTGALQPLGRLLMRMWLINRSLAMLATLVLAAFVSAFANNTPIVVMLLPILVGIAHRLNTPPSRMLMPVGFATIIGGMCTTIGTSTNLLIVSVSEDLGLPRLQMFDFALPAVMALSVAVLYLWLFAPRLLPDRSSLLDREPTRLFTAITAVPETSSLVGQPLSGVKERLGEDLRITKIRRGKVELVRLPTLVLRAGDQLHLHGTPEAIQAAHEAWGITVETADYKRPPDERLVEIVVTRGSPLEGRHLQEVEQGTLQGLQAVGWHRSGEHLQTAIERAGNPKLQAGDVLLLRGRRQDIQPLKSDPRVLLLARSIHVPRTGRAPLALATMTGVVLAAALGIVPIAASAMAGVALMLISRCITLEQAWEAVDMRLVLVIIASLSMGAALVGTGAAAVLAHLLTLAVQDLPPAMVLSGLLLVTALLTEVVTNNAIAVIATPIAMSVAAELGLPPLPFVLAVLFGANMSYLTPIGYQTNLLVMSAGAYKFSDFFRAGLPLQLILWLALSYLLPAMYF